MWPRQQEESLPEVFECELADVELVGAGMGLRVGGEVPGVHVKPAKLNNLHSIVSVRQGLGRV